MGRKIPVADEAIAQVAMTEILREAGSKAGGEGGYDIQDEAAAVIEQAAKVRYQQSTRQLVLTFDLGMSPTEET